MVAFRTICDSGLIGEWGFICWDRVYTYTGNAHTTEYIFPSSLTYQSIHQYLIETINLSLLEPHFIYRLRWKARRVWGRKQQFKWKDLFHVIDDFASARFEFLNRNSLQRRHFIYFPTFHVSSVFRILITVCTLSFSDNIKKFGFRISARWIDISEKTYDTFNCTILDLCMLLFDCITTSKCKVFKVFKVR